MPANETKKLTQQEVADHLFLARPSFALIVQKFGLNWKDCSNWSLDQWREMYITRLREEAAGRDQDLSESRARKELLESKLIELKVEKELGNIIEKQPAKDVLNEMCQSMAAGVKSEISRVKPILDAQFGIDVDMDFLNEYITERIIDTLRNSVENACRGLERVS
ncbi:hypothetical protein [Turicimonas sp. TL08]